MRETRLIPQPLGISYENVTTLVSNNLPNVMVAIMVSNGRVESSAGLTIFPEIARAQV